MCRNTRFVSNLIILILIIIHLFTCVYIVWVIAPPYRPPPPSPRPTLPGRTCSALISNFIEEKT
jgi:hypothetical protein